MYRPFKERVWERVERGNQVETTPFSISKTLIAHATLHLKLVENKLAIFSVQRIRKVFLLAKYLHNIPRL